MIYAHNEKYSIGDKVNFQWEFKDGKKNLTGTITSFTLRGTIYRANVLVSEPMIFGSFSISLYHLTKADSLEQ